MIKHISFLLFLIISFSLSSDIFAAEIITSEDVVIDSSVLNDNYYVAGSNVYISSNMLDDLSIAGGNISINGNIAGDLNVAANEVNIEGDINDDLMIFGGSIKLSGNVSGDVLIFGGKLDILDSSKIDGDVIILGGEVNYQGNITGDLTVITGKVVLDGYVSGDSVITTQSLVLGDLFGLSLGSTVSYFSPKQINIPEELKDNFVYNRTKEWRENRVVQSGISSFFSFWSLFRFITTVFLMYLLIYLFKPFTNHVIKFGDNHYVQSFIIGLITTVALPAIAILLMVSLIGLPIGLILLIIFSIIFIIRIAVASMIVGGWLRRINDRFVDNRHATLIYSTIGLLILSLVQYIPYIGETIFVIVYIIAIGSVINYLYKSVFKRLNN